MVTKKTVIKIVGAMASIFTFAAPLVSEWIDEQKTEAMIDEKVNEAMSKKLFKYLEYKEKFEDKES